MSTPVGHVAALWRFPVKSMGGERVDSLALDPTGVRGDRWWAVRDLQRDAIVSARKLPAMLGLRAAYVVAPAGPLGSTEVPDVAITLPDGSVVRSDDPSVDAALSAALGRDVRLEPLTDDPRLQRLPWRERLSQMSPATLARDFGIRRGDPLPDLSRMRLGPALTLARNVSPPGSFVDLAPLHVLTLASVRTVSAGLSDVEPRRFRANVLLDGVDGDLPEADWPIESLLLLGDAALRISNPTVRCVVPSRAHDELPVLRELTSAVAHRAGRYLGVYADVAHSGLVTVGSPVALERGSSPTGLRHRLDDVRKKGVRGVVGLAERARR